MKGPIYISVEGLVGAGKSTLIDNIMPYLHKEFGPAGVCKIDEPVNTWIERGILKKSYENPKEWGFFSQCMFFHTRINEVRKQYNEHPECGVFISERSPYSDTFFWEVQHKLGRVDPIQYEGYYDMWNLWQKLMPPKMSCPTLFVYLKPDASECLHRAQIRGRESEKTLDLDYQKTLEEMHDNAFGSNTVQITANQQVSVLIVDGNCDFKTNPTHIERIAKLIINKAK